jgi:hypothetical protein
MRRSSGWPRWRRATTREDRRSRPCAPAAGRGRARSAPVFALHNARCKFHRSTSCGAGFLWVSKKARSPTESRNGARRPEPTCSTRPRRSRALGVSSSDRIQIWTPYVSTPVPSVCRRGSVEMNLARKGRHRRCRRGEADQQEVSAAAKVFVVSRSAERSPGTLSMKSGGWTCGWNWIVNVPLASSQLKC